MNKILDGIFIVLCYNICDDALRSHYRLNFLRKCAYDTNGFDLEKYYNNMPLKYREVDMQDAITRRKQLETYF